MAVGKLNPLPNVLIVGVAGILPLTATISFTVLVDKSETKTSPLPSTATPNGATQPLPSVFTQPTATHPGGTSYTAALAESAT